MNTPGQQTAAATVDAIDAAVMPRCGHCNGTIPAGCVSDDFCCEGCQRAWTAAHHGAGQLPHGWSDVVPPAPARRPAAVRIEGQSPAFTIIDETAGPLATMRISSGVNLPDQEYVQALIRALNERLIAAAEQARPVFEELGRAMQALGEQLCPILPEQPPTDPMERALWLRRNRNTGPRPRQRAPRRIDPRGSR